MKRFSISLIVAFMIISVLMLTACGHKHSWNEEWKNDETSHWHVCEDEECTEIQDKADHTWDDGVVTAPTAEADGAKTFTCTVCKETKKEIIPYTGMTEEEWDACFAESLFDNLTYEEKATVTMTGMNMETSCLYKIAGDKAEFAMNMFGEETTETLTGNDAKEFKEMFLASLFELIDYSALKYDSETKSYIKNGKITSSEYGELKSLSIVIKDGKIAEYSYEASVEEDGYKMDVKVEATFKAFGTTVVE